jgi:hypothetical protein
MLTAAFFGAVIDFSLVVSSSAGAPASEADEEFWGLLQLRSPPLYEWHGDFEMMRSW